MKKYCDCFNAGIACVKGKCKCNKCQNTPELKAARDLLAEDSDGIDEEEHRLQDHYFQFLPTSYDEQYVSPKKEKHAVPTLYNKPDVASILTSDALDLEIVSSSIDYTSAEVEL